MAYDRKQDDSRVAVPVSSHIDYRLEVGRIHVQVGVDRQFVVLDRSRGSILRAWTDTLIPGSGERPAAGEMGAAEYIDATVFAAPRLRALLLDGVDSVERIALARCGDSFVACDMTGRATVLHEFVASGERGADCFAMVQAFTYEAYYAHPHVLEMLRLRTGWDAAAAVTGSVMTQFDERLLGRVRTLPPLYRKV